MAGKAPFGRTAEEKLASFGGRAPYGALPPLHGWPVVPRPMLISPFAARFYSPFGDPFAAKAARRYRLEALKGLARHLDGVLNDLWEEIVKLEDEDGKAG